ncbi:NADH dehydrogenase FAD-containing subunit [Halobacteriales archaeon QS_8_69_26]|nr:MAG: NADH dehydrogenase FAD-containing subunit [Halobacteriales archaeon QS_8_69_26]
MEAPSSVFDESRVVRVAGERTRLSGSGRIESAARREAASVTVAAVGSTGVPAVEPLVLATVEGRTAFHPRCSLDRAREVVAAVEASDLPDGPHVVASDPGTARFPRPGSGPLSVGTRHALAGAGWLRPASVGDYAALAGGVRSESAGDGVVETVADAGLLGRGRGDLATADPVADSWQAVRAADGDPVVVVNANEADEGARMDQLLLESCPLAVLDPALALAGAVGATDVVVYVNESDGLAYDRTEHAADALRDRVEPGDDDPDLAVVAGPDEYTAGEETMALESLEGNDRIEARRRPPGPETHGLHGRPTLVHTPRTLAQVGALHWWGPEDPPGVPADPGTRLFTVTGDVATPATVELPTDAELSTALAAVDLDRSMKAACVGGRFGGVTGSLGVPASASGLSSARLGTGGVVEVLDGDRCLVALAGKRAKLAREDNCGRCVPCREGSKQLTELLRDVYAGDYEGDRIRELGRVMTRTSVCAFGRSAPRPVLTAMDEFEEEFAAHANGRCPTGTCRRKGS